MAWNSKWYLPALELVIRQAVFCVRTVLHGTEYQAQSLKTYLQCVVGV